MNTNCKATNRNVKKISVKQDRNRSGNTNTVNRSNEEKKNKRLDKMIFQHGCTSISLLMNETDLVTLLCALQCSRKHCYRDLETCEVMMFSCVVCPLMILWSSVNQIEIKNSLTKLTRS